MAHLSTSGQSAQAPPGILTRLKDTITFLTGPWTFENGTAWLKIIIAVLLIRWLWVEPFSIPSGSMEPTLHGDPRFMRGDRVAVNKLAYGPRVPFTSNRLIELGTPERWDIVVFYTPEEDAEHRVLIKRVAGLPGERVHIANGLLHVNGEPLPFPPEMPEGMRYTNELEEIYRGQRRFVSREQMRYGVLPQDEYSLIPEGHYLMLGDNSARSRDGRHFGWVPDENMIGRAFCIWWPWNHRRDFTGFSQTWWGAGLLYGIPASFVLYWLATALVAISLRVEHGRLDGGAARGEHVLVNRLMAGVRIPFTDMRLTQGRLPARGELIAFAAEPDSNEPPGIFLGRVVGLPGQRVSCQAGRCHIDGENAGAAASCEAFAQDRIPEHGVAAMLDAPESQEAPPIVWVPYEDILGNVVSVWWPLNRARAIGARPMPSKGAP